MKIKKILKVVFFVFFVFFINSCFPQGAAINTTATPADQSAILDISSTNAGMLIPRMTKIQRSGISQPAEGLMIYQTDDTTGFWYYNGTSWKQIGSAAGSAISAGTVTGNTLYWNGNNWVESSNIYNTGGSVGIGTNNPDISASIDLGDTTKGTLINRLTTTQRNAIQNPAEGLQIFNIDTKCFEFFVNNVWEQISCAFKCGNILNDNRDGNNYKTVQIGNQCWMKDNLRYLPSVVSPSIGSAIAPYYYVYGYDGTEVNAATSHINYNVYGVLYNWSAAMGGALSSSNNPSGVQGACPIGWHLPSDGEWKQLEIYLSMDTLIANNTGWRGTYQGDQLKESGSLHWLSGNSGTNLSGFTALPGGYRLANGSFSNINSDGYWRSTTDDGINSWSHGLHYAFSNVGRIPVSHECAYTVRCIKDN